MTSTLTDAAPAPGAGTRARPSRSSAAVRARARSLWRGRDTDAAWVRPSYLGLLAATAVLYVWNLGASGWANAFYSAAVQAGTRSWEAFFYGSSDAGNSITVDKPPASLWVMELSARIFGLSSWSILLPEALMGVLTVALVYAIVRRHFSAPAALIAGAAVALTPVAVLMFKFNNPDALLVLLLTAATYCTLRGIESCRIRWIVWAGVAIGFAFLTKQLQAFLIVPVLGVVYLYASPRRMGARLLHLLAGLGAIVVSAGWWVAIVELVPASMRPYIGGSQTNDFLELTFGYNGFGRLTGNETGSVTPGQNGGAGAWGETGALRLFNTQFGGQISWLLPAALVLLVASLVLLRRRPRIDGARATVLLLGGTLLVTGAALSFGAGIIHPYYSVALAPAIGGLVGVGGVLLWQHRTTMWVRVTAAGVVLLSGAWSWYLLAQAPTYLPWLKAVVALAAVVGAAALLVPVRTFAAVGITAALVTGFAGPAAFAVTTTVTAHTGSIPSAGPAVTGAPGGVGGAHPNIAGGQPPQGLGQGPHGGFPGAVPGQTGTNGAAGGGFGGAGGLLGGDTAVSSSITSLLRTNAGAYRWAAAAVGSQTAASYQLASGESVLPIGGFNGSDPSPTLAEFQQLVREGRIHYFIASGRGVGAGGSNGGSNASSSIASWVAASFTATTVGGGTMYDLTSGGATSSSSTGSGGSQA